MNSWQLLEISADSDIPTIKRAYAAKIKQYRPDVDPEMFQRIHKAYKSVIAHAQTMQLMQTSVTADEVVPALPEPLLAQAAANAGEKAVISGQVIAGQPQTVIVGQPQTATTSLAGQSQTKHSIDGQPQQLQTESLSTTIESTPQQNSEQALADLLQQVDNLLADINKLAVIEQWQFLAKTPWLLDGEFNHHLGGQIYRKVVAYNGNPLSRRLSSAKRRTRTVAQYVPYQVLNYLDKLFNWRGQRDFLIDYIDSDGEHSVFHKLDFEDAIDPVEGLRGHATVLRKETKPAAAPVSDPQSSRWNHIVLILMLLILFAKVFKAMLEQ